MEEWVGTLADRNARDDQDEVVDAAPVSGAYRSKMKCAAVRAYWRHIRACSCSDMFA
jgi:hypothetical protein